jgi:hypothetical protein
MRVTGGRRRAGSERGFEDRTGKECMKNNSEEYG